MRQGRPPELRQPQRTLSLPWWPMHPNPRQPLETARVGPSGDVRRRSLPPTRTTTVLLSPQRRWRERRRGAVRARVALVRRVGSLETRSSLSCRNCSLMSVRVPEAQKESRPVWHCSDPDTTAPCPEGASCAEWRQVTYEGAGRDRHICPARMCTVRWSGPRPASRSAPPIRRQTNALAAGAPVLGQMGPPATAIETGHSARSLNGKLDQTLGPQAPASA